MNLLNEKLKKQENIVYLIAVVFIIIPIALAFFGPKITQIETVTEGVLWWKKEKEVIKSVVNPFQLGTLPAVFGCFMYTIIIIRNLNTFFIDEENKKISIKNVILHLLNLIFTTTLFMLLPKNATFLSVNIRVLIVMASILSLLCMKSLSGILWVVIIAMMAPVLTRIDNWTPGYVYVITAYISLFCQVFFLKVFKFNINMILQDFGFVGDRIIEDINASKEVLKKTTSEIKENVIEKMTKYIN